MNKIERAGAPQLLRYLNRVSGRAKYRIVASSTISGLSRGLLLATFNAAAVIASEGNVDMALVVAFATVLTVHLFSKYDSNYQGTRLVKRTIQQLRLQLCEKLLFSQLRFVERKGASTVYAHISADITLLGQAAMVFVQNIEAAIMLFFAFIYIGWLSIPGLIAALLTLLIGTVIYRVQDSKTAKVLADAREKEDEFFSGVYELVEGFKELKLNRAQHVSLAEHLHKISSEYRRLSVKGTALHQVTVVTSEAFIFGLVGVLIFVLPPLFPSAAIGVFQFLATVLFMIAPAEQLLSSANAISHARIALSKIEAFENELSAGMVDPASRESDITPFTFSSVELQDVHYQFEALEDENQFDLGPINLRIDRGEVLFVCGGNGAGKTTLLKLLTGLYYPSSGSLLVDGERVSQLDKQRYREMFGVVFGDFYLFRRLYGLDNPDPKFVQDLLQDLQIHDKTRLDGDMFTTTDLSSGQRKRLAYAVSRLSDRQIYVFDEFAADQDPGFREYFYTAIVPE
ncbi:MAG: cyclic peptide export ABC transporter, partial [Woeseiales bacterium]